MRIKVDFSALARTKWYEYAVRFLFGGAVTVATGLIAKHYGPGFGGLFLAFPAIFPASATLVEKHEREKKVRGGIPKSIRGRQAAGADARGTALGSIGLAVFALIVWKLPSVRDAALVLLAAFAAWLTVSILIWRFRKGCLFFKQQRGT